MTEAPRVTGFPSSLSVTGLTQRQPFSGSTEVDDINGVTATRVTQNGFSFIAYTNLVTLTEPLFVDWEASYSDSRVGCEVPAMENTDSQFSLELLDTIFAQVVFRMTPTTGVTIDWGDGTQEVANNNTAVSHTYAAPYTGQVTFTSVDDSVIDYISLRYGQWVGDVEALPKSAWHYDFWRESSLTGIMSSDKFPNLQELGLRGQDTFLLNIENLPEGTLNTSLSDYYAQTPVQGDIGKIPPNTLSGTFNINSSSPNVNVFGLIEEMPVSVGQTLLHFGNGCTVGGDIGLMDQAYESISVEISNNNTVTGDVALFPPKFGTTNCKLRGSAMVIYGLIENMPSTIGNGGSIWFDGAACAVSGDITNASISPISFSVAGVNTITGDIAAIPATVGAATFSLRGTHTMYGDIATITPGVGSLYFVSNSHDSNITGNLANKPVGVGSVSFDMKYGVDLTYSGGITLAQVPTGHLQYVPDAGLGFSAAEMDQLLIDLAAVGMSGGRLTLTGDNAARTAASDAAIATLTANGVTLAVN